MTREPTYEELEQRIKKLEKQAVAGRQAQKALRESEEKYVALVENSLTGIFIHQDGKYVFVNDRFAEIHGYQPGELLGQDPLTLIHPDQRDASRQVLSKRLKGESVPNRYEVRRLRKDGSTIWCEMMATPIQYSGRAAIMGNIIDITERNRAEEALRQSEANYRMLFAAESDAVIVADAETREIVNANEATLVLYGYAQEELLGLSAIELSAEPEKSAQHIKQVAARKPFTISAGPDQRLHKKKDGTIFPVEISSGFYTLGDRKMVCAVIRDITERKKSERALRESEEKYREVVERANDGIAVIQDGLLKYGNRCLTEMTGYTLEEAVDTPFTNYVWPDEVSEAMQDYSRRMAGEPMPIRYERGIRHKNGSRVDAEISGGVITYQNRPANLVVIRDISERKQAQKALQESSRQLQVAYEQAVVYAQELNAEINERKRVEEALRQRKEELKSQAQNLEEVNTALKVVVRQRDKDRTELEEKVVSNIKELVLPYVETLKKGRLDAKQMAYVGIIEANLNEILSPFLRKFSSQYLRLTPKEIQIADLIKLGKTTKEIAELLNISMSAIQFHRENIRAKLGLKNEPINLRTHLLSFC